MSCQCTGQSIFFSKGRWDPFRCGQYFVQRENICHVKGTWH